MRRGQARGARPDHGAAERATHLVHVPRGPTGIAPREGELLHEERCPLFGRVHAHQEAEDPPPHILRQCRLRRSGVVVSQESGCGQTPSLLFLFGRQAASGDQQLALVRLELPAQQRDVPRAVRHRAQERVHVGRGEGRFDPRCLGHARRPQPPMCLTSSAIWLLTSTWRGSLSMATARDSAVQRSSVSTESAIDHPA